MTELAQNILIEPISDYDKIMGIIGNFISENIIRTDDENDVLKLNDVYQKLFELGYFNQMTRYMHPKESDLIEYLQKSEIMHKNIWFKHNNAPDILINCVYNTNSIKIKEKLDLLNKYYESFISQTIIKTNDIRDIINIDLLYKRFIKYQNLIHRDFYDFYNSVKNSLTKDIFISYLRKLSIPIDKNGNNACMARFVIQENDFMMNHVADDDPNYMINYGFTVFGKITVPIVNFITQSITRTTESRDLINLNLLHDEFISYHDKKWKMNKNHPDYLNQDIMIKIIFDPWLIDNGYKIITINERSINEEKYITNVRYLINPVFQYYDYTYLKQIQIENQFKYLQSQFLKMVKITNDMRDKIDIDVIIDRFKFFLHDKKGKYIDEIDNIIDKNSFTTMISKTFDTMMPNSFERFDKEKKYIQGARFEPSVENYYLGEYDYRVHGGYDIYIKYGSLRTLDVIEPDKYANIYTVPIINFIAHNLIISGQVKDELDLNLIYERFNGWYHDRYKGYNAINMDIFTECLISNEYKILGQTIKYARYEPKTLQGIIENKHTVGQIEDYIPQIIFDAFMEYYKSSDQNKFDDAGHMHNIFIEWYIDKFNNTNYPRLDSFIKFLNRNKYKIKPTE
jgi:hypothetical protein